MTTYDKYMDRVAKAGKASSIEDIVVALSLEKRDIQKKLTLKLYELSVNKNPFPAREAKRCAVECIATIDRIIAELKSKKEVTHA